MDQETLDTISAFVDEGNLEHAFTYVDPSSD